MNRNTNPNANPMREVRIEKLTLNIGAGKDQKVLERGVILLKHITGIDPVKTVTQKRIAGWGLRPGLPIGTKITIRDRKVAKDLIKRLFVSQKNTIRKSCFDDNGNVSFGIKEYIDIPGVKYNPDVGMLGFQATITLGRPGYRISRRKIRKTKVPLSHRVNQTEAIEYIEKEFKVKIE